MKTIGDTTKTATEGGEFQTNKELPGTVITPEWLNTLQKEIIEVIKEAGIKLDPNIDTQLKESIKYLISNYVSSKVQSKNLDDIDLNTLFGEERYGLYHQNYNANATTERNYPISEAGYLMVYPGPYGGIQEYTAYSTNQKFVRGRLAEEKIGKWKELLIDEHDIRAWNNDRTSAIYLCQIGVRSYLSKFINGKWTGETTIPDGNGTLATREWSKNNLIFSCGEKVTKALDYYAFPGYYQITNWEAAEKYYAPIKEFGVMSVEPSDFTQDPDEKRGTGHLIQRYTSGHNGYIFTRKLVNGVADPWRVALSSTDLTLKNVAADGNGFIKKASPIVKIFPNGSFETNDESEGATVERESEGVYTISNILGYNSDGAWGINGGIGVPKNNNGLELIYVDDKINPDGSITIETFHRQHSHLPKRFQNNRIKDYKEVDGVKTPVYYEDGEVCDIPDSTQIDVRVEMPEDSIWNLKMKDINKSEVPTTKKKRNKKK